MAHDDNIVVAYLWGELDPVAADQFERHLVDCDSCWAAVGEDFQGRAAAETLRELAPPALRDHIRFAMEGEKGRTRKTRRRPGRAAAALVIIVIAGAVIAGVSRVGKHGKPADPAAVAEVVRLAHGQVITLTRIDDGGVPVVVARSDRPFPMPDDATAMLRADSPWVAERGGLSLVCVNRPHPVLLAARLPADQLTGLAAQLAR